MFSVMTNNNAMAALQALNNTQRSMSMTQNRITTGQKVAGATDDASTFTIAQGMRGDVAGLKSAAQSIALGKSTVGVALDAATQISDTLNTLKQKITDGQAQNVDLAKIQQDIDTAVTNIQNIVDGAQFNGVNLIDGVLGGGLDVLTGLNRTSATNETIAKTNIATQDLQTATLGINALDVTAGGSQVTFTQGTGFAFANGDTVSLTATNSGGNAVVYTFEITDGAAALTTATDTTTDPNAAAGTVAFAVVSDVTADTPQQTLSKMFDVMRDAGFTVSNNEDGSFDISSQYTMTAAATSQATLTAGAIGNAASAAFDAINTAITNVNNTVAYLGTMSNSLDSSAKFVSKLTDSLTVGVGQLVDADMAEESANLQALQTRQQLGIQALSIANSQPGAILSLFRG